MLTSPYKACTLGPVSFFRGTARQTASRLPTPAYHQIMMSRVASFASLSLCTLLPDTSQRLLRPKWQLLRGSRPRQRPPPRNWRLASGHSQPFGLRRQVWTPDDNAWWTIKLCLCFLSALGISVLERQHHEGEILTSRSPKGRWDSMGKRRTPSSYGMGATADGIARAWTANVVFDSSSRQLRKDMDGKRIAGGKRRRRTGSPHEKSAREKENAGKATSVTSQGTGSRE